MHFYTNLRLSAEAEQRERDTRTMGFQPASHLHRHTNRWKREVTTKKKKKDQPKVKHPAWIFNSTAKERTTVAKKILEEEGKAD